MGQPDYPERSRSECFAYWKQLERLFPITADLVGEVFFKTREEYHGSGPTREVCIGFNCQNEAAIDFAFYVDARLPATWDEEARVLLGLQTYESPTERLSAQMTNSITEGGTQHHDRTQHP